MTRVLFSVTMSLDEFHVALAPVLPGGVALFDRMDPDRCHWTSSA
jgi:hypothetical protein